MNINLIKEYCDKISEVKVIGKDFEFEGTEYHIIGLYREEKKIFAAVLAYNEEFCEKREWLEIQAENSLELDTRNLPLREIKKLQIEFNEPYCDIESISFADTELLSFRSHRSYLNNNKEQNIILFLEFLRNGWNSGAFGCRNFRNCSLGIYELDGEFSSLSEIDTGDLTINFRHSQQETVFGMPITLEIGECDREVILSNGEKIYIRSVNLTDMWLESAKIFSNPRLTSQFSPEHLKEHREEFESKLEETCPKGTYFLCVEYEAATDVTVDIQLKSVLDAPEKACGSSAIGIIFRTDTEPVHENTKIKTCVINEPFSANTQTVEAEIFSFSKMTKPKSIKI